MDRAVVLASSLRETIAYTATGADSGQIEMSFAPTTTAAEVEEIEVNGRTAPPSGDTLQVRSPAIAGTVVVAPGATTDAGSVALVDGTGAATSAPVLHFAGLGRGTVVVDGGDAAGDAADRVRITGQPDADVFTLTGDGTGRTTTTVDTRIPVVAATVTALQLNGLEGQDIFNLPLAHGMTGGPTPAIAVDAGPPSGGDVAIVTAAEDGSVVVDLASRQLLHVGSRPIAVTGLDRIDLAAASRPVTVLGGSAPDSVTVRPTGISDAQISSTLLAGRIDLTGSGGLTIDTRDGADRLTVLGGSAAEVITVTRGTLPTVRVGNLLAVTATDTVEAIGVDGLEGADTLAVQGAGGPASLAVDGGLPPADGDVVQLQAAEATVTFDDPTTNGQLDGPGGALSFVGVQRVDVAGDGSGTLTVRGTDGADIVTLGDPGTPSVRVNAGAAVTYAGYPTLRIDGRGGDDTTTVSYANLGDVAVVQTEGGSALDDRLRIVDVLGTSRSWTVAPSDADRAIVTTSGAPTVAASGSTSVELIGRGGGDVVTVRTPEGAQDVVVRPGAAAGTASVLVGSLLPLTTNDLGADGRLVLVDTAGRFDRAVIDGTAAADAVRLVGSDGTITLAGLPVIAAPGADRLAVRTGEGGDTVHATGPLPWTTTVLEGGGPDSGDRVVLDGPTGDALVDTAAARVTGYGGTVLLPEFDALDTVHGALGLTLLGTDSDDGMCYDALSPRDGRVQVIASPNGGLSTDSCTVTPGSPHLLHSFTDVGRLVVDPRGGSDQVLVNGTVAADAIIVESTADTVAVSVNADPTSTEGMRLSVHVVSSTTENLVVSTDNGNDAIELRLAEAIAPLLTIHGEAPDTSKADRLTVRDTSGGAELRKTSGSERGSGVVTVHWKKYSGILVRVVYTGIEEVQTVKMSRPRA